MLPVINHGDVAFMVIATVLVAIMTPGLAFFYGGLVEKKNSLTMMFQSFVAIGIVTIMWIFGGFSLVFGNDIGGVIGNPAQFFAFRGMDFLVNPNYGSHIPFLMFFMYQLMFAIITAPLMTGAFANRINIGGWIKVLVLWMIFVYFPVAHWIWGGGFLAKLGFVDYAGGTVIHITAGFAGLVGVWFFGPRAVKGKKGPGNLTLVAIGTGLLLFGWFGFNSGGALASGKTAAIAFTNTGVAAGVAMVVWMIIAYLEHKRFSFLELVTGAIAGCATITPCAGYVTPLSSVAIGIIAAIVCFFCVVFTKKMKWDDALDVWGVHGMGGLTGTLLIGIFANKAVNGTQASVHQFLIQLLGVVIVTVWTIVISYIIFKVCDLTGSIRTTKEQQEQGLDIALLGEYSEADE